MNPAPAVTITALSEVHIPDVIAACADWRELAQFGPPYWRPRSSAELKRKIAASAGPAAAEYYFVVANPDGRLVGECSVHAIDWRNRVAEIGVAIWNPDDRRLGNGRAALREMESYAFDYLGLNRVEGWIIAENSASLAMVAAAGWQHEGKLRERYLHAGQVRDVIVVAKTARRSDSLKDNAHQADGAE